MAWSGLSLVCAAALCLVVLHTATSFVAPVAGDKFAAINSARHGTTTTHTASKSSSSTSGLGSWGLSAVALGAQLGLVGALYGRTVLAAAADAKAVTEYKETAADARLFQQVYMDYTSEYLKGPLYWDEDKLQGALPDYPGTPMFKNGKMTSNATGNLKTFSSNELGFMSLLFFAIGLYGNIQFLFIDPQWARVDAGENFNVSYIVESLFLPISFFMHIAAYIQKQNGK